MVNFKKHEGTQAEKPPEIDTESSKTAVYIRRNIERKERTNENSDEKISYWEYEEAIIPREYYAEYIAERANAKIDYIIMMQKME